MGDQVVGKVYNTADHSKFKHLIGNREITPRRIAKIKKSIINNGYIFNPIIVNEKMEIIDGQGRQWVLKELGLPIDYIIRPGMTVTDCQSLNSAASTWTTEDYIFSHCEEGNVHYKYLSNLVTQFPELPIDSICFSITGNVAKNKDAIQNGSFVCTEEQYNTAITLLNYAALFVQTVKKANKCRANHIYSAVMFVRTLPNINYEDFLRRFEKYYLTDQFPKALTMNDTMQGFSKIYNYGARGRKKVYFEIEYKTYQEGRNAFYSKRYGDGKEEVS